MPITIAADALETAMGLQGKWFPSKHAVAVCGALRTYHADKNNPVTEINARQALCTAIYNWKDQREAEFNKYDTASDGAVRKLSVQAGFDFFRPPAEAAVLFSGHARAAPMARREADVVHLQNDAVTQLREYTLNKTKCAIVVIDLYGSDFRNQGLEQRYDRSPATVADSIKAVLRASRMPTGVGTFEHLPVFICGKTTTTVGQELVGDFKSEISSCYIQTFRSATNSVLHGTGMLNEFTSGAITHAFVMGFDANVCVAVSIFGGGGTSGQPYIKGFLDHGISVVTSRFLVASGDKALQATDGWPYMGRCNL